MTKQLPRRTFIKGLGVVALAAHLPALSRAVEPRNFSAVLHEGGEPDGPSAYAASAGLLLHQQEDQATPSSGLSVRGYSERWKVTGDLLIQVPPGDAAAGTAIAAPQPYVIRQIGSCRTGIIGLSLAGAGDGWMERVNEAVARAGALSRQHGCNQVYCIVDTPAESPLEEVHVRSLMGRSRNIDQWFVSIHSDRRCDNKVRCLPDASGNQVTVSINARTSGYRQRLVYQAGRISYVQSSLPA